MGIMTLQNFQDEIEGSIQRSSIGTTLLNRWVNQTIQRIAYAYKFPFLETSASFNTVDGQASYQIGSGLDLDVTNFRMLHTLGLRKTSPSDRIGKLIKETRQQYLLKIGDTSDSDTRGDPTHYHRYGKTTLYLRPIPDSTIVAVLTHYWKKVTPLASAGDVTEFDDEWDDVFLTGAIARAFRYFGEWDRHRISYAEFTGLVREKVLEEDVEEFPEGGVSLASDSEEEDFSSR